MNILLFSLIIWQSTYKPSCNYANLLCYESAKVSLANNLRNFSLSGREKEREIYYAQAPVLCGTRAGFRNIGGDLLMYTEVVCNTPASITFVSSLQQSGMLNTGVFSGFSEVDRFSETCTNKTECRFVKRVKNSKRSSRYRLKTIYVLHGVSGFKPKETVTANLYVNKKGALYPSVKTTRTFNWGEVYLADDIPEAEKNRYVPFPSDKILLKQSIARKGNPLYACLQVMWKDRLEELYKKNKWVIPNDNEAHHIYPVEYGGIEAYGSAIVPSSNLPKLPIFRKDINKCFNAIKVGKFYLDNGVLLSKPDHRKFSSWWASF